jgi:hypothetical protein
VLSISLLACIVLKKDEIDDEYQEEFRGLSARQPRKNRLLWMIKQGLGHTVD